MEIAALRLTMQKCLMAQATAAGGGRGGWSGKGEHLQSTGPSLPLVLLVQRIFSLNSVDLGFNLNGDFCFFFFFFNFF